MKGIFDERLLRYVQCDIEVSQHLRRHFSIFPPIFKTTVVNDKHIDVLMEEDADKQNIMVLPRRMLISSFH